MIVQEIVCSGSAGDPGYLLDLRERSWTLNVSDTQHARAVLVFCGVVVFVLRLFEVWFRSVSVKKVVQGMVWKLLVTAPLCLSARLPKLSLGAARGVSSKLGSLRHSSNLRVSRDIYASKVPRASIFIFTLACLHPEEREGLGEQRSIEDVGTPVRCRLGFLDTCDCRVYPFRCG